MIKTYKRWEMRVRKMQITESAADK